jgi:hypothetical protein
VKHEWTGEEVALLGVYSDREIGRRLGLRHDQVRDERLRRNIPRTRYWKNIRDKEFGRLTAVEPAGKDDAGHSLWRCRCACGNDHVVTLDRLQQEDARSCGCIREEQYIPAQAANLPTKILNRLGKCPDKALARRAGVTARVIRHARRLRKIAPFQKNRGGPCARDIKDREYGKLVVLRRGQKPDSWVVRCKCGRRKTVDRANLLQGRTTSCGNRCPLKGVAA